MAEMNQFGSARPGSAQACGRCEALLMDMLDGAVSAEDQAFFDAHVASCTGCSEMLADARRGGAWLEMLRDPRPQPPATLFDRILAQTSGAVANAHVIELGTLTAASAQPIYPHAAAYAPPVPMTHVASGGFKLLPFGLHGVMHTLGQTVLQPRLAMTAAMAFFSIALTLNLTGVHVGALRVSDLRPSNLRREFYTANAHVVHYCDNLRVVYELEARTRDLQRTSGGDDQESSPASSDEPQPRKPQSSDPADQLAPRQTAPAHGPGTSRREPMTHDRRMVAELRPPDLRLLGISAPGGTKVFKAHQKGDPA